MSLTTQKFRLGDIATVWTYYIQLNDTNYLKVSEFINKEFGFHSDNTSDARDRLTSLLPQFAHLFKKLYRQTGDQIYDDLFPIYGTRDPEALVPVVPQLGTSWENLRMVRW